MHIKLPKVILELPVGCEDIKSCLCYTNTMWAKAAYD